MTESFTASNGITVFVRDGGTVQFQHGTRAESCGILQVMPHSEWWQTLREFFQHERDEELGRWRWPENPEYVVYSFAPNNVRVFRESVGKSLDYMDEGSWTSETSDYSKAARAYFDAHPEQKPWSEAVVGEVWVVAIDGVERALLVDEEQFTDGNEGWYFAEPEITAARRIWPEGDAA